MISTKCEGICSRDDRTVECLWKTSGRALGRDFRSRKIIEKYNFSVCRLSSQYVNLLIVYLFISTATRPQFLQVLLFSRNPPNPWVIHGVRGYDRQPRISTSLYFAS